MPKPMASLGFGKWAINFIHTAISYQMHAKLAIVKNVPSA